MKRIWKRIDGKTWKRETKYRMAVVLFCMMFSLAGFGLWMVLRRWICASGEWMLCFIGYPALLSPVIVFLYDSRHEFHDGAEEKAKYF